LQVYDQPLVWPPERPPVFHPDGPGTFRWIALLVALALLRLLGAAFMGNRSTSPG
jgi:hypothetical protein